MLGKSTPEQSKYLSFVRRGSPNLTGSEVGSSGSRQTSPAAKVPQVSDPEGIVPLGEAKGVVSSVDPIAGGIVITTESGEHLDIKVGTYSHVIFELFSSFIDYSQISQPAALVDMIKVLKELTASMRYIRNSDKPVL